MLHFDNEGSLEPDRAQDKAEKFKSAAMLLTPKSPAMMLGNEDALRKVMRVDHHTGPYKETSLSEASTPEGTSKRFGGKRKDRQKRSLGSSASLEVLKFDDSTPRTDLMPTGTGGIVTSGYHQYYQDRDSDNRTTTTELNHDSLVHPLDKTRSSRRLHNAKQKSTKVTKHDVKELNKQLSSMDFGEELFAASSSVTSEPPQGNQQGNHALQDYQMQLMLLEQQNKKRLLMARQEQDSLSTLSERAAAAGPRQNQSTTTARDALPDDPVNPPTPTAVPPTAEDNGEEDRIRMVPINAPQIRTNTSIKYTISEDLTVDKARLKAQYAALESRSKPRFAPPDRIL